jgi:multidrug efflux pump subunit AcrA (membrane-fusion protein)
VVDALAQTAREGRLMVWSAHKDEQALLSGTVLSGELVGVQGKSPVIGLYLNDGSAAKIGYYLRTDVLATSTGCRADGSQAVTVRVTLTNTAPANAAELPPYLTGGGAVVPEGEVRTNVLLYAPSGGRVEEVRVSGGEPGVFSQTHNGLAVVGRTVQLRPGERIVIDYDVLTGQRQPGHPVLRVTPVTLGKIIVKAPSECS